MTTENLPNLIINKLSQKQFDREKANGTLQDTELYLTPDTDMSSINPTGTGSFSLNRKEDSPIGRNSFAEGTDTVAGGKCFIITAGNEANKTFTLDSIAGLSRGDVISCRVDYNFDKFATIEKIEDNVITISKALASSYYDKIGTDSAVPAFMWVPGKPELGTTDMDMALEDDYLLSAHAEGLNTIAQNIGAHAEGSGTIASGRYSHTEGVTTFAAYASHAEGKLSEALGDQSHAEGYGTEASGYASHAEGRYTVASGDYSHAEGDYTIASAVYQHVQGIYNIEGIYDDEYIYANQYLHTVGNGTSVARSNAHTIDWTGNAVFAGTVSAPGADYAEHFEWLDGNPNNEDRVGTIVALDGDKIRSATAEDEILGVVSGTAMVIGDNAEWGWQGKFLTDDYGRVITEMVEEFIDIKDPKTGEIKEKKSVGFIKRRKLNPDWNANQKYARRSDRPEWDVVGLFGKLHVTDDGTCVPNGWATVGEDGKATASATKTNMRVMKRITDNIILVFMK